MTEQVSRIQDVWPQQSIKFCEADTAALICHVLRWKERNPDTRTLSIVCWKEGSEAAAWCDLTYITPCET